MSAHALASAALNAFILESNRGGDLQAAYKVLEGHCLNKRCMGGGRNYPENMHDM
jgi:hypothetical protein